MRPIFNCQTTIGLEKPLGSQRVPKYGWMLRIALATPARSRNLIGRRPTLPHTCACSTIGAERLNFRVRDGNGWIPSAIITRQCILLSGSLRGTHPENKIGIRVASGKRSSRISPRPIRIRQLNTLLCLHPGPIYLVICKGSYFHEGMGNLILRGASRLDAFSAYPFRT